MANSFALRRSDVVKDKCRGFNILPYTCQNKNNFHAVHLLLCPKTKQSSLFGRSSVRLKKLKAILLETNFFSLSCLPSCGHDILHCLL